MPLSFQRHPRYLIVLATAVVTTIYLLSFAPGHTPSPIRDSVACIDTSKTAAKIALANQIYDDLVERRKDLIRKFGPEPKDIDLFPPDVSPWPPYTVWDFFPAAFNCPHEVRRLGALGDGGKWICGISRLRDKPDCVIYSFGINYESSFEYEVLSRTKHCQVWGYDFSVTSFGPEIPSDLSHRTHFKPYGLSGEDKHGPDDKNPMYTLESLMKMNGHTHIDLLKIDIEGWEFGTLTTLLENYLRQGKALPFGQLSMEIHLWGKTFEQFLAWWNLLEEAGLRPFWTEPNLIYQNYNRQEGANLAEYTFLNIKGDNAFIKDRLFKKE